MLSFTDQCRQLVEKLDETAKLHPRQIEKETDQIQRDVVRLRDGLIDYFRQADISFVGARDGLLDTVNVALSLIVAVEYPVTSIQRSALEQARDTLKKALDNARGIEIASLERRLR
jgi:hypothetical protein